jgi:enhancer of polycomb-like protein
MAVGPRFRQRKLNVKTQLQVLREEQLDGETDQSILPEEGTVQRIETGVEKLEEKEHHLQVIINATQTSAVGGNVAQLFIPTPETTKAADVQYDQLYPPRFQQPATYIRFSSTVEDCIGCPYCMSEEDDKWLSAYNAKAGPDTSRHCSEDHFEQVMYFFEETSQLRQPFAAVDNTPVLSYDEMSGLFDDTVNHEARQFAPEIYAYWRSERESRTNQPLVAHLKTLKIDAAQEADDSDPYVCFRRREVRQVRKTRGRDAQVADKLKKLRKELEDARQLLHFVHRRELCRQKDLALSKQIFEQRASVRELKRTLNIEGPEDDELLLTQRSPKKRPMDAPFSSTRPPQQIKLNRGDSMANAQETETIILLRQKLEDRERKIAEEVNRQIAQLERYNANFVDNTEDVVLGIWNPSDDEGEESRWVTARVEYTQQPTPPDSEASGDENADVQMVEAGSNDSGDTVRWAVPFEYKQMRNTTRFRRRAGRGGMFLDRRVVRNPGQQYASDRDKYDRDSGDEMDVDQLDVFETKGLYYRNFLKHRGELKGEQPRRTPGGHREGGGQQPSTSGQAGR